MVPSVPWMVWDGAFGGPTMVYSTATWGEKDLASTWMTLSNGDGMKISDTYCYVHEVMNLVTLVQ